MLSNMPFCFHYAPLYLKFPNYWSHNGPLTNRHIRILSIYANTKLISAIN